MVLSTFSETAHNLLNLIALGIYLFVHIINLFYSHKNKSTANLLSPTDGAKRHRPKSHRISPPACNSEYWSKRSLPETLCESPGRDYRMVPTPSPDIPDFGNSRHRAHCHFPHRESSPLSLIKEGIYYLPSVFFT